VSTLVIGDVVSGDIVLRIAESTRQAVLNCVSYTAVVSCRSC